MNAQPTHGGCSKVTARQLQRSAYLYVRQSTVRQVIDNSESTQRQYALRQRAIALGWPADRIIVIDTDLGQSGASAVDRQGFQRLVADVGMGQAGIVLGLEVSRLARNCTDWHRLLEICALTETLILDEDGLYDPAHFNDRLLLGLKGTMSEAELHMLRCRLRGGLLNKARRGELRRPLPVGLVYDPTGRIVCDPDKQVQHTVTLLFDTFARTGTARATVKHFRQQGWLFPKHVATGARKGELCWGPLSVARACHALHNPFYAGAYVYGRSRHRKQPDGRIRLQSLPQDQWQVLIRDAHCGYISWQQFEHNQQQLRAAAQASHLVRRGLAAREGPALLQGRAVCGLCGSRMHVHYQSRKDNPRVPHYVCSGRGRLFGDPQCQSIIGTDIDAAIGNLVVEAVTPMALQLALDVQREVQARLDDALRNRRLNIERAQYDADSARSRYMQVDPSNRLVADALEADWNAKLRTLEKAQHDLQQQRSNDQRPVDTVTQKRIHDLAADFPAIWNHPDTPHRERKRMLALLIEDVTLIKQRQLSVAVRFRGGATTTLTLPRPLTAQQRYATDPHVRDQIDTLLDQYTDARVAHILNQRALHTGRGGTFDAASVQWVRFSAKLKSLKQRLLDAGWVTGPSLRHKLGIGRTTLLRWRTSGRIQARICNDRGEWLYWSPDTPTQPPDHPVGNATARGAV